MPDPTLFLLLKIGRLTETDLFDALVMIRHAREHHQPIEVERVRRSIESLLGRDISEGHRNRLERLLEVLTR